MQYKYYAQFITYYTKNTSTKKKTGTKLMLVAYAIFSPKNSLDHIGKKCAECFLIHYCIRDTRNWWKLLLEEHTVLSQLFCKILSSTTKSGYCFG